MPPAARAGVVEGVRPFEVLFIRARRRHEEVQSLLTLLVDGVLVQRGVGEVIKTDFRVKFDAFDRLGEGAAEAEDAGCAVEESQGPDLVGDEVL